MIAGHNDTFMTPHAGYWFSNGKKGIREGTWDADPVTACKFAEPLTISLIQ